MFSRLFPLFFDGYACVNSRIRVQNCLKTNRHGTVTRLREQIFRHGTWFTRAYTGKISSTGAVLIIFWHVVFMHQSIPTAPIPPPGNCGAFARIVSPEGRALAYPRTTLGLLTHTWCLTRNPNEDDFIGKDQ